MFDTWNCLKHSEELRDTFQKHWFFFFFFVFSLPDEKIMYPALRLLFLEFLKIIYICIIFLIASYISQSNVTRALVEPFNELWNRLYSHCCFLEKFIVIRVSVLLESFCLFLFLRLGVVCTIKKKIYSGLFFFSQKRHG